MKTGELASILGINASTIRVWLAKSEFQKYFSSHALKKSGTQRIFTESDVLAVNTISRMRQDGKDWQDIIDYLDTGQRIQDFPQSAIGADTRTIPVPQAEQSARAAATVAERDSALARVSELENKLEKVESEKDEIRSELTQQIIDLNREIGILQGKLEQLQSQDDKPGKRFKFW